MNDKWQDSWDEWQDTAPFVASEYLQFQNGVFNFSPNSYPSIVDGAERRGTMLNLKYRPSCVLPLLLNASSGSRVPKNWA